MSWNIWGGKRLPEVIEQIREINPDIIGLQEVRVLDGKNHGEIIAEQLGYRFHYCKSLTTDRHTPSYVLGNALLSKLPFRDETCHFLSTMAQYEGNAATEPRTAAEITIEYQGEPLTIMTTHLAYSEGFVDSEFRDHQLDNLLLLLQNRKCIIMGDFNSLPESHVVHRIEQVLENADEEKTKISYIDQKLEDHPEYRIDYIFGEKTLPLKNFRIIETNASDHRLLIVEI